MTDSFEVQGDFSPAESFVEPTFDAVDSVVAETPVEVVPNGFVKLGLADELLRAVADLGYTQPTLVQDKVIPLALPTGDSAVKAASST
jgi:superfamily II DNA/RNA helicase